MIEKIKINFKKIKEIFNNNKKLLFSCSLLLIILCFLWITRVPEPLFKDDYSQVIYDEDGKILRIFLNSDDQWIFAPDNDKIPEKLKIAVINYEDKRYYFHMGVDLFSIVRAIKQLIINKKIVSGASTITMQVARLIKPKERTLLNKVIEMVQAYRISLKYSKREILKQYLSHAPYGGNIIGYKAASLKYFGKMPNELTWGESALLAVIPNNPTFVNPEKDSKKLKLKRDRLLKKLMDKKIISLETYNLSILEPVPEKMLPFPVSAPHLCYNLSRKYKYNSIKTTISKEIQDKVTEIVKYKSSLLSLEGIRNASALIVETKTGKVKAYVGSQNYWDNENNGKIDGIMAKRSPGSTLKPFLYALSIDAGLILPDTKIADIPYNYGSFSPYNADRQFSGLVSARDALINSLNAPSVLLLRQYGLINFYNFLKEAGMKTLFRNPNEYGLPLILGGGEATLWDIVTMYKGLGSYGNFSSIYVVDKEKSDENKQLISRGASYLILDILKDLTRPGSEQYWEMFNNQWPIAWKTGTSYGERDAWAIGVTPQWTIGVWVGNFTGEGNNNLYGAISAGSLLFSIFNFLPKDKYQSWFVKDIKDFRKVKLCSETGYLAGENCLESIERLVPKNSENLQKCPYHVAIYTTLDEKEEVCSLCWDEKNKKKVIRLNYSPEIIQYLTKSGHVYLAIPPHKKNCPSIREKNAMEFIYPKNGSYICIPRDINSQYQKITVKVAHKVKNIRIFWYLDENYIGETRENHNLALDFSAGWHKLVIVDESGLTKSIKFYTEKKE